MQPFNHTICRSKFDLHTVSIQLTKPEIRQLIDDLVLMLYQQGRFANILTRSEETAEILLPEVTGEERKLQPTGGISVNFVLRKEYDNGSHE